jgi:hypothetical protein
VPILRIAAAAIFVIALAACGGAEETDDVGGAAPPAAQAADGPVTVELGEENGSGQTGTATLTAVSADETRVVVEVTNPPAETQPAHIHRGSCADLDPAPLYGLPNLIDGRSETTVPASLDELGDGGLALNVHRSDAQLDLYVACGNLPGPPGGGDSEPAGSDGY